MFTVNDLEGDSRALSTAASVLTRSQLHFQDYCNKFKRPITAITLVPGVEINLPKDRKFSHVILIDLDPYADKDTFLEIIPYLEKCGQIFLVSNSETSYIVNLCNSLSLQIVDVDPIYGEDIHLYVLSMDSFSINCQKLLDLLEEKGESHLINGVTFEKEIRDHLK